MTILEIYNAALMRVGDEPIISLSPLDNTKRARVCNAQGPRIRRKLLTEHNWKFAKVTVTLTGTLLGTVRPDGLNYEFDIPTDFLKFFRAEDENIIYTSENTHFYSDQSSFVLEYIKDVTDVADMTVGFIECYILQLAMELAVYQTNSKELRQDIEKELKENISKYKSFDSQLSNYKNQILVNTFKQVRY